MPEATARNAVEAFERIGRADVRRKPWLTFADRTISYGALSDAVRRLSAVFFSMKLAPGARVILSTADEPAMCVMFIALLRNGITAVLVDPDTRLERFHLLRAIAAPDALILDENKVDEWQVSNDLPLLRVRSEQKKSLLSRLLRPKDPATGDGVLRYPDILDTVSPAEPPAHIDPSSGAYSLFTSGTTAAPRAVLISHRSLFAHAATHGRQYGYDTDTRILNVLKLYHADGLIQGPFMAFVHGAAAFRPVAFQIHRMGALLDSIYTHRITHFIAVPTLLALIRRLGNEYVDAFRTGDFRMLISAADLLEEELWRDFEERFGVRICNQYGLTETVTAGLFCGPGDGNWRIGTVGRPVDCRVRLVDEGHSEVRDGETGELLLNGDMVMDGYLNDPAATAEALVDGWLRTGDYLSCDPDGFYVFRGRRKMLIIRGGINVHPEEVTTALRRHPEVADAVTFGEKDDTFGERVESCVVLTDGAVCTSGDLVVWCREQLEEEKVPSRIHLLPALPRGAAGKVNIAETRALLAQETVIAARVATDDNIADTVRHIAAGVFNEKVDGLAIHATAADVAGWDSLAHLQLVAALEEHFHIALSTAEIMGIERLADAVRMIESRRRP